jgi:hypothetical protein
MGDWWIFRPTGARLRRSVRQPVAMIIGWVQDVFYGGALVIAVTLAQLVARRHRA